MTEREELIEILDGDGLYEEETVDKIMEWHKKTALSWFKEQLPSVNELTDFMEGKYDVTDDYGEASEGLAKEIHTLILTNLTAKQGER